MTTLLVAILSVLGTLVVTWFGGRLTRENENRAWRRDHALEAYSDLIRLVEALRWEASAAYNSENYESRDLSEKLSELSRTINRVTLLLASRELHAALSELAGVVGSCVRTAFQFPKVPEAEMKTLFTKLAEKTANFLSIARNDLGVPIGGRMPQETLVEKFWHRRI